MNATRITRDERAGGLLSYVSHVSLLFSAPIGGKAALPFLRLHRLIRASADTYVSF